jgi:solute carrier family 35 protein F5
VSLSRGRGLARWVADSASAFGLCFHRQSCGTGTSVSNSTLLSSSSSVFTFVFSVLFLRERFSLLKLACTVLNLGGVALLVSCDRKNAGPAGAASAGGDPAAVRDNENSVAGDCMAVLSAACSAAYAVQLKWMMPAESGLSSRVSMPMLFGFLGITVCCLSFYISLSLYVYVCIT